MKSPFSIKELCGSTESVVDAITQALTKGKSEIADIGREARLKAFEHLTSIDAMVESLDRPSMLRIDPVLLLFGVMDAIRKYREEHTKPKSWAKRVREEDGESTEIKRTHYEKVHTILKVLFPHFANLYVATRDPSESTFSIIFVLRYRL